jgi:predicted acyl esterase
MILLLAFPAWVSPKAMPLARGEVSPPVYDFKTETTWLTMKDGVRLSATLYQPVPRNSGEKFPVLLEFLPYRKDDGG